MPYEAKTWYIPKWKLPPDEDVSSAEGAGDLDSTFSSSKGFFSFGPLVCKSLPCPSSIQACTTTILKLGRHPRRFFPDKEANVRAIHLKRSRRSLLG